MTTFKVDEPAARAWLLRAAAAHDVDDADLPPIGAGWDPREVGEEDTVSLLVCYAQQAGVLTTPPGVEVAFEHVADAEGGYYRWLVDVATPVAVKLASWAEEMRHLGEPDATGVDAAMSVLREAAEVANNLLAQLADYVAAAAQRP